MTQHNRTDKDEKKSTAFNERNAENIDGLRLIRPAPEYLESYRQACVETFGHVHNNYIIHDPDKFSEWKDSIFRDYAAQELGNGLPPGYVPSATFWLIDHSRFIGAINIRLRLNKALESYGGHIGLFIRLSERNKGYGKKCLPLALDAAGKLGISPVLLMCTEDNAASRKVLLSMKAMKSDSVTTVADGVIHSVMRFWF